MAKKCKNNPVTVQQASFCCKTRRNTAFFELLAEGVRACVLPNPSQRVPHSRSPRRDRSRNSEASSSCEPRGPLFSGRCLSMALAAGRFPRHLRAARHTADLLDSARPSVLCVRARVKSVRSRQRLVQAMSGALGDCIVFRGWRSAARRLRAPSLTRSVGRMPPNGARKGKGGIYNGRSCGHAAFDRGMAGRTPPVARKTRPLNGGAVAGCGADLSGIKFARKCVDA